MKSIYFLAILGVIHCHDDQDWKHFKNIFNKNYINATEDAFRRNIFEEEIDYIEEHNKLFEQGHSTFSMGINKFSDWTLEEFQARMIKNVASPLPEASPSPEVSPAPEASPSPEASPAPEASPYHAIEPKSGCNPPSHNWRDLNVVTEVKDQGICGSSEAYAAVGAIEGVWAKDTGLLYNLSGQEMVDCGEATQNYFETIINLGGILTEEAYPYSCGGACQYQEDLAAAHMTSYSRVPELDETMLGTHLYKEGPITVLVDGSLRSFKSYSSGIYWDPECGTEAQEVNHGLLLVAYDMRPAGDENHFYTAKNSWGTSWGMDGYVQLRMWVNTCNVARYGIYPIL